MEMSAITLRRDSWEFGGICVRSGRVGLLLTTQQIEQFATTDNAEKWSILKLVARGTKDETV